MYDKEILYHLVLLANKATLTTTDDEIILYLLEHREEIPQKSLRSLMKDSCIPQSTVSKFLRKIGISYHELQVNMGYCLFRENAIPSLFSNHESNEEIVNKICDWQMENINQLRNIDFKHLEKVAKDLLDHQKIVFIGSDFSMSIINSVQAVLIETGKDCYTMQDSVGQMNILETLKNDDLIIYVSIKGRWVKHYPKLKTAIFNSKAKKELWTIKKDHEDMDKFDDVFFFGKEVNPFGYTQLTTFTILIAQTYIQLYKNHTILSIGG